MMRDDTVQNQQQANATAPPPPPTHSSEPCSLLAARQDAEPLDRQQAMTELARCLTLCAPSGMSSDERATWLATAWAEIADVPAAAFTGACAIARRTVEHPAKLIPAIIRESVQYAGILRRRLEREEGQWHNRNAPRIAAAHVPEPWEADQDEVKAMMAELRAKLSVHE